MRAYQRTQSKGASSQAYSHFQMESQMSCFEVKKRNPQSHDMPIYEVLKHEHCELKRQWWSWIS